MGKEKFLSGFLPQLAPPSFGSGKGEGGCARGLGLGVFVLFMVCSTSSQSDPPLPPPPHHPYRANGGSSFPVVPTSVSPVVFLYPSNVCDVQWTIQGSSNLMDWVDIQECAVGCPSGDLEVGSTNGPCYFYRLKGKNR